MSGRKRSIVALVLALACLCTGCWDSREIDRMAIVVGTAVDLSQVPGMVDLTVEVANTAQSGGSSGQNQDGGSQSPFAMLKATGDTVRSCMLQIDQNSNRTSMPKHNQIRLFGSDLCQQGLKDHLDMFMRDQQTRLEVPMLVVEGNAGEALSAKVAEAQLCGLFLAGMLEDQAQISPYYRVRLIDFMKILLSGTTSAVIPLVKLFTEDEDGDKQQINITGMAVFKDDKMVGRLSNDDGMGYIWAMGKVKKGNVYMAEGADKAILHLSSMNCKRKVSLSPEGTVRVELALEGKASIGELVGFGHIKPPELLPYLERLAQKEIKDRIYSVFTQAQALRADIFGFGTSVYHKYPHEWESMKDNWDAVFQNIDLAVTVDLTLSSTGQIVQSIEMMEETRK